MSVRIYNKEVLDYNDYNKIVIMEVDGNYLVQVVKNNDKESCLSYKSSDTFTEMNDDNKIICIVDSFLHNTTVNSIETGIFYPGCSGELIKVDGIRTLYLHINNSKILKDIIKMIKDKYNIDRYKFCNNNLDSVYEICLGKMSSYERINIDTLDDFDFTDEDVEVIKYTEFMLMYNRGKIVDFDRKFIIRFIYDKLWEYREYAKIIEVTNDININGFIKKGEFIKSYNIICGDLVIKFNCNTFNKEYVFDLINIVVDKYNSELLEIDKIKKRQLKMEGF